MVGKLIGWKKKIAEVDWAAEKTLFWEVLKFAEKNVRQVDYRSKFKDLVTSMFIFHPVLWVRQLFLKVQNWDWRSSLQNPEVRFKLLCFGLLIVLLVLPEVLYPGTYAQLEQLLASKTALIAYFQQFGAYAMLASFVLDVLVNAVGFLPSIFISAANGCVFGLGMGIVVSWLAETAGVIISFLLMRFFMRDAARELISTSETLQRESEKLGLWRMFFLRSIPFVPNGLATAVGAISEISFWDYSFANLLGKFFPTALEVAGGFFVLNFEDNQYNLLGLVLFLAVAFFINWYLEERKKYLQSLNSK